MLKDNILFIDGRVPELVQGGRLKIYCVFTLTGSSPVPAKFIKHIVLF